MCRRWVIDAILYVARTPPEADQWRQLPSDLPNWKTVYNTFWNWRNDGTWRRLHDALREKARKAAGKKPTPTAAVVAASRSARRKGASCGATTRGRRSPAASGTSRSTRWGCCCRWWSTRPACRIRTGRASCSPG
ncbi:transposase [Pseudobythopirellula maris]|uniref:transposase n=1 Tax=Pseudobythopirellula maris TaxID=2527991 RepID=UPI0037046B3C